MIQRFFLLLVVFTFLHFQSKSQILNVNRNEILTDTAKFVTGSIGFKFHLDNKNATPEKKNSFISLQNKNDLVFVGLKHNYILISQIKYFNSSGGTFISSGHAHARTNLLKMRKLSYEVFTQIQYDRNRYLDNRFILGGGLRWRISNTEKTGFFIGTELMYEHEKWDNPEDENHFIIKDLPKFSGYLSFRIETSSVSTFRSAIYYQTGYDPNPGTMRDRLSFDIHFEIEVMRKLYFTIKFIGLYEDKPIYPINKFVYALENGLVWRF